MVTGVAVTTAGVPEFDVRYEDGDMEKGIPLHDIRHLDDVLNGSVISGRVVVRSSSRGRTSTRDMDRYAF